MSEEAPRVAPAEPDGISEEELAGLMGSISAMAPLLKGLLSPADGKRERSAPAAEGHCHRREALLLALKPYLSPARREAADYLLRMFRVADVLKNLMKEEG